MSEVYPIMRAGSPGGIVQLGSKLARKLARWTMSDPVTAYRTLSGIAENIAANVPSGTLSKSPPMPTQNRPRPRRKGNIPKRKNAIRTNPSPLAVGMSLSGQPFSFGQAKPVKGEGSGLRLSGRELLCAANFEVGSTGALGFPVTLAPYKEREKWLINPANFYAFSRITKMSKLFDKFSFRKLRITFVTSVATTHSGQIALGHCRDPADADRTFSTVLECSPSAIGPLYQPIVLDIPLDGDQDLKYVTLSAPGEEDMSPKLRFTCQGAVTAFTNITSEANLSLGIWVVDYICDFYSPCPGPQS
jgi:hypothetical protein